MPRRCARRSPRWRRRSATAAAPEAGRRRLHHDRGREHGERDQENFGAARLRRDPLCAQLLRRRRRPARLPRRRRARHDDGADPSAVVAAVGLRHGARRYPQRAPAGDRGAVRRRGARHALARAGAPARRTRRRARSTGQGVDADDDHASHVRAHIRYAGTDTALEIADARPPLRSRRCRAARFEDGFERAQGAVRLRRPRQAAGDRGGLGRGGRRRRRRFAERGARDRPRRRCRRRRARTRFFSHGEWHDAGVYTARDARAGAQGRGPGASSSSRTRPIVVEHGWQARDHGQEPSRAAARQAARRGARRSAPTPIR